MLALEQSKTPAIAVRGLAKTFGAGETRVEALRGIDLEVPRGQFVAVMGPSGSGKSTLLHLIGGLDRPTTGSVQIGGNDCDNLDDDALALVRRRQIGFVFQTFNLLDVLTALENVALPLVIDGATQAAANERALAAMHAVGIEHRASHRPTELSGGEQQRVAVARALVTEPLVLLADEPTGNLDTAHGDQVMQLLRQLVDERGQTIFMVTHDPSHAVAADRLILLRDGMMVDERQLARDGEARRALLAQGVAPR
ncbi:MAG: ABC transporter ATP-binding protein [Pirellulales bacterium]|nr:ABC transporter ATP-binding protein [Pirellulales bacterium]